jgi:hypothetical protein
VRRYSLPHIQHLSVVLPALGLLARLMLGDGLVFNDGRRGDDLFFVLRLGHGRRMLRLGDVLLLVLAGSN